MIRNVKTCNYYPIAYIHPEPPLLFLVDQQKEPEHTQQGVFELRKVILQKKAPEHQQAALCVRSVYPLRHPTDHDNRHITDVG